MTINLTALDWVLLAVFVLSCLVGMWRGLIYEALMVVGWIIAFIAARWSGPPLGALLPLNNLSMPLRIGIGCTIVFSCIAFVFGGIAWRTRHAVRTIGLQPVDGALGAAFGIIRALAAMLAGVALAHLTAIPHEPWWKASVGVYWLEQTLRQLYPYLPPLVTKYISG